MDIVSKLEFDKIRLMLKNYTHTQIASKRAMSLSMLPLDDLKYVLNELDEAIRYTRFHLPFVIYNHQDLLPILLNLKKNGTGNIEFFSSIKDLLVNVKEVITSFEDKDNYPYLKNYISRLNPLESLKNRIDSIITKDLDIYDNASNKLFNIRNSIKHEINGQNKLYNSLLSKYQKYLNSERLVLKDQGLALPIQISYKNRVEGVTIGISSSGNTAFILPIEILISNQKIESLKLEEQEEILRILLDLGRVASQYVEELKEDLLSICSLDFLFAKVALAHDMKANIATISESNEFVLKDAIHPLIDRNKVISNSFYFNKERILLITGPNAGGKTVFLKMVGLLILMHQCGLAIPSSEASLPYFSKIYVDIGDEQSLDDHLSTFTGHIKTLNEALNDIDSSSFVILDELGTGTSPTDGQALAVGVLEYLNYKKAYAMVSSHYDGLKSYAIEKNYILNASMIFDEENLSPTYKIRLNVVGKSYGLEVASKEGLNSYVLNKAKEYLKSQESESENKLKILNEKLFEVDKLKAEVEEKNVELNKKMKAMDIEISHLQEEKRNLLEKVEEEKQNLLLETKEEIDEMMKEFKNKKEIKLHEVIALKKKVDDALNEKDVEEIDEEEHEEFKDGDRVKEVNSSSLGTIKKLSDKSAIVLLDSGLSLNVKLSSLRKVEEKKVKKKVYQDVISYSTFNKNVPLEVNLIGLRVLEGIEALGKYLDDARTMHYKVVRVIHGYGTGRLKKAVWDYLKKQSYVESYRLGDVSEGGAGATVVNLK